MTDRTTLLGRCFTRRNVVAAAATLAMSAVGLGAMAPGAFAAQWNDIGSNSATTTYYENPLNRHVSTPNDTIQLQLSNGPAGGLYWILTSATSGAAFAGPTSITSNATFTLATGVISGTVFHNKYRGIANSGTITGREYY